MSYSFTMIVFLAAVVFTMYAQSSVNSNFKRYSNVRNQRGITGAQAARAVLDANGLTNVQIEQIRGSLTDHYDPRARVLRLSQTVYGVASIAAISVACHEAGHAIQHAEKYAPLTFRNNIVPIVNIASRFSWVLIMIGFMMIAGGSYMGDLLFDIGVLFFVAVIVFHAVTLPVEFNASNRALDQMQMSGIIYEEEERGAKKVLKAAAMTYVASLAVAIANLLRILAMRGSRD
ncbi:MAG: zinc metallopeptidase [Firmicutes bacterium]|nr:zinc metallopeptidase [Bacillota bacterium]